MSDLGSSSCGTPKDESTGTVLTHLAAWCLCQRDTLTSVLGTATIGVGTRFHGCGPVLTRKSHWLHVGTAGPLHI